VAGASDVVVVGGGVVGTAVAYFASARGLSCTVLDKGRVGSGASHAASGALSSSPGNGAYARLGQRSRKLYHKLAPVIREESGVDIEFAQCGELILAFDEEDVIGLQGLARQFTALGEKAVWMSSDDLFQMEPGLNPAIPGAMFTPDVCRVNNQRLSGALAGGAAHHGATIRQGVEVTGLVFNDGRVTGVRTTSGTISAGCVVLAAGAWTGMMDRWLYGDESPSVERQAIVRPVKGVNLNLQPRNGRVNTIIHGSWGLLVPRNDGSMIVGATVEEAGFDCRVTAGDIHAILGIGAALMPSLADADLNWSVAGLRPRSADDVPSLGRLPGYDNVLIASGHFRNGILLSLATGEALADILTDSADDWLSAFDPARLF
jgi:glycine oxidase